METTRKIVLGGGSKEVMIINNISEVELVYKGFYTRGINISMHVDDFENVGECFNKEEDLDVIEEMNDDGTEVLNVYQGFTKLYSAGLDFTNKIYTVTLARPIDYQEDIKKLTDAQSALSEEVAAVKVQVDDLTATPDPSKMELNEAIEYLAEDSKNQLGTYLENHPITSTVHGGVEAKYSITREKQNMLTSMILMTQMAKQSGLEYTPSWNATNEPCTYDWTVEELQTLAVQIESTVRPLISLQQTIESNIRKATTVEEAIAAAVNFEEAVANKQASQE